MINLLPPKEKEILLAGHIRKLAMIWGIIILSAMICLIFVLLSIYFYGLGEIRSQNFYLQEAEKSYQSPDSATYKSVVQKYNKVFPQIHSFYREQKYFSDALNVIYAISRPNGVSFLTLSLDGIKQATNSKEIFVSIAGISITRENLIIFQNNLLKETSIKNVSFSPESWISSKNTNFNVSFSLTAE